MKKHHEELTEQIITAHKQHQKLYEEFLREKYYLDEIAKLVKLELAEETRKRQELKIKTRKEMEAFESIKQEMQRVHEIILSEENQRIREYCEERDRKIEEETKRRLELERNREILNQKMIDELQKLEDEKLKRENLLQELWAFEQNEKNEEKLRKHLEYRFRVRVETRLALENQLREQQEKKTDQAKEDEIFREKQLKMWAERDKLEQMSDEKKRRKMTEYRKSVKEILDQRKSQRIESACEEIRQCKVEEEIEKRK